MANNKAFKIKNGLSATRYYGSAGTETAGSNGPYGLFSTTTYVGAGAGQLVTTGVDANTNGGLVWIKSRDDADPHMLFDTERTNGYYLPISTDNGGGIAAATASNPFITTTGFDIDSAHNWMSASGENYVAWSWAVTSDFFDIVTYTGDGTTSRSISHNLGSAPGSIFIKKTDSSGENWIVWHRSISNQVSGEILYLNTLDSQSSMNGKFDDTNLPTSTTFTVEQDNSVNASGASYVAYLFGHDTSADGYIQCGSYTGNGSTTGPEIDLGWKPSWILIKDASTSGNWVVYDTVRGLPVGTGDKALIANSTAAEDAGFNNVDLTDTGFKITSTNGNFNDNNETYIYMAIRAVVQTKTLDLSTGHTFSITPTEALDVLFTNPPASGIATGFTVEVDNSAGGYALTWPSSVKWHLGTAPTATASKEVYTFITTDGGTTYYGKLAGKDIA
jgi:hypothetical protein